MAWSRALLSVTAMDVCAEPETEYPSSYRLIPRLAGQGFWFVCLRWSICLVNRKRWYQVLQHLASSMSRRLVDFFWHPRCNFTIIDVNVLPWGAKMLVCGHGQEIQPRRLVCSMHVKSFHVQSSETIHGVYDDRCAWLQLAKNLDARSACLTDGKICRSSWEPQQEALHSMKSISKVLLCSFGLIRFQLLKEFLLADEMRPSSISTEPRPEILASL